MNTVQVRNLASDAVTAYCREMAKMVGDTDWKQMSKDIIASPASHRNTDTVTGLLACILTECSADLDRKNYKTTSISALKRIIGRVPEVKPALRGVFQQDGKFCVCDGYVLVRLNSDIASLPHAEGPKDSFSKYFRPGVRETGSMELPDMNGLAAVLRAEKAEWKKENGKRKFKPAPYVMDAGFKWYCNPELLLDLMQALGGGLKACRPASQTSPMYASGEYGEGILMPLKVPEKR